MGALWLCIYNCSTGEVPVNIDFVNGFMQMSRRGLDQRSFFTETMASLDTLAGDAIKRLMTKEQMRYYQRFSFIYGFHRSSINDLSYNAVQPIEVGSTKIMCNGEVYNHEELAETFGFAKDLTTGNDAEVLLRLFTKVGLNETLKAVNGDYSFVITTNTKSHDLSTIHCLAVRDAIGSKPLYIFGNPKRNFYIITSEIKSIPRRYLTNVSKKEYTLAEIPPGHYWSLSNQLKSNSTGDHKFTFTQYHTFDAYNNVAINCTINKTDQETLNGVYECVQQSLSACVIERYLCADTSLDIGILLSGGFDSGVILSILCRYIAEQNTTDKKAIHAFTYAYSGILKNDEVLAARNLVQLLNKTYAGKLKVIHHVIVIDNIQLYKEICKEVVHLTETSHPELVRNSVIYYHLAKYISTKTNIKILLSGIGSDELFAGDKGSYKGISDVDFQNISVQLLKDIGSTRLREIDRIFSSFGLEVRTPYLDMFWIEFILSIHPKIRKPIAYKGSSKIEKYIIRNAFNLAKINGEIIVTDELIWKGHKDMMDPNMVDDILNLFSNKQNEAHFYKTSLALN